MMKPNIDIILLKLVDGARVLRLSEPISGLCLEKRLEPDESVARQKQHWQQVFRNMLEQETGATG